MSVKCYPFPTDSVHLVLKISVYRDYRDVTPTISHLKHEVLWFFFLEKFTSPPEKPLNCTINSKEINCKQNQIIK